MAPPVAKHDSDEGDMILLKDMIWMRDRFILGMVNLENGVRELREAYVRSFNSMLGDNHPDKMGASYLDSIPNVFGNTATMFDRPTGGSSGGVVKQEKPAKRSRKPHDKNAPKRALTSYFLYMPEAKPAIQHEHPDWTTAQVNAECEKRWKALTPEEKQPFDLMYNIDLARYYKQVELYHTTGKYEKIGEAEARRLYEGEYEYGKKFKGRKGKKPGASSAGAIPSNDVGHSDAAASTEDEDEDDEEEDHVQPVPESEEEDDDDDDDDEEVVKEPTPPPAKRAKTEKSKVRESPPKAASGKTSRGITAVDKSLSKTTDKKTKGARKSKAADPSAQLESEVETMSTPMPVRTAPMVSSTKAQKDGSVKRKRKGVTA